MQASPRDYARLGVFILNGAQSKRPGIVPEAGGPRPPPNAPTLAARARLWRGGPADVTAADTARASSAKASSSTPTQAGDRVRTPTGPTGRRPPGHRARENFYREVQQVIDEEAKRRAHDITPGCGPARLCAARQMRQIQCRTTPPPTRAQAPSLRVVQNADTASTAPYTGA